MSRSGVYGTLEMTPEQRAAREALRKLARVRDELRPAIAGELRGSVQLLQRDGLLGASQASQLLGRVDHASSLAELRQTAVEIGRVEAGLPTGATGTLDLDARTAHRLAEVDELSRQRSDGRELAATLASITTVGQELGLELAPFREARASVQRATALVDHRDAGASGALEGARCQVAELEARIDVALDAAEARSTTIDAVLDILVDAGLDQLEVVDDGGTTRIVGRAADGRSGEVEVSSTADGKVGVQVAGDDPGSTLTEDDLLAGDICTEAVLIVAEIERNLPLATGLRSSELVVVETAVRGQAPASAAVHPPTARTRASQTPKAS